jgi:hypothetical protein
MIECFLDEIFLILIKFEIIGQGFGLFIFAKLDFTHVDDLKHKYLPSFKETSENKLSNIPDCSEVNLFPTVDMMEN